MNSLTAHMEPISFPAHTDKVFLNAGQRVVSQTLYLAVTPSDVGMIIGSNLSAASACGEVERC